MRGLVFDRTWTKSDHQKQIRTIDMDLDIHPGFESFVS